MTDRALPLAGIRVLDLGRVYQGPWCGFLFAMAGAEVIKIEELAGEPARRGAGDKATVPVAMLNSNKQGITLNLKHPEGRDLFLRLVEDADVVIENFAPGTMEDLGLGAELLLERNPRLVYGAATGYGVDGPDRDQLAMDITIQAHSGVMSVTGFPGEPPVKAGVAFVDFLGGAHLYAAIMTALFERSNTGVGRIVDVAMADTVFPTLAFVDFLGGAHLYAAIMTALFERSNTGVGRIVDVAMIDTIFPTLASNLSGWYRDGAAPQAGNGHGGGALAPYNVYPTTDGHIAIIVITEAQWPKLCAAMGRPELATDDRFRSNGRRYHNIGEVDELVGQWTGSLTRDEAMSLLRANKVPAAAVRDVGEVVADAHMLERGAIQKMDHPDLGELVVPHSPLRFRGTPLTTLQPSPRLGADNGNVYGGLLGLTEDEVARLHADGVI